MSFFNKTFRSILGLSNSENQPTSGRRYPPSPGGLTLISTTAGIASPATVLESVTLKPTPSATTAGKKITIRTDDMHDSIAGCFRPVDSIAGCFKPVDLAGDVRARLDRYATLTECIGFESCDLTAAQVSSVPLTAGARKRETMRREEVMVGGKNEREISPPVMSSLNENGRPRFNLEKTRKDGRLLIYKVRNDRPEIVRTVFPEEDRIKIRLIGF